MQGGDAMVYLNGRWMPIEEASIPVLDRGFIFGDGVYEVVPVYGRKPFRLEGHLARLEASLKAIAIANPHTREEWRALVAEIIARQPFDNQGVYFQVTRGVARRDHAFPRNAKPTVFMMSNPLATPSAETYAKGVACVTAVDNRWLRCDIKSTSLLGNVLMRQFAAEHDALETVMFRDGMLTEASASNVLVVKDGVILSPPQGNLMLPGITLDAAIDLARAAGLPLTMRPISEAEVRGADELWLSSSTKEVLPITRLDGVPVGHGETAGRPGPMFARIRAAFDAAKAAL
ncbi:MAG: D-amino acid aminotransferase [Burkholderiales bacterium]|nr:D-amino acid aminotransferase [Burkholderiales bacterium]